MFEYLFTIELQHLTFFKPTLQMVGYKEWFTLIQYRRICLSKYYRLIGTFQRPMQLLVMCGIVHANSKYLHRSAKIVIINDISVKNGRKYVFLSTFQLLQIVGRYIAELFLEAAAEVVDAVEARHVGHLRDGIFALHHQSFGILHLVFADVFYGREPRQRLHLTVECAGAHAQFLCQIVHINLTGDTLVDILVQGVVEVLVNLAQLLFENSLFLSLIVLYG